MQMNTVKITLQEYKRLILAERNLNALVDAIVDNSKIYVSSYLCRVEISDHLTLDDDDELFEVLKLVDRDGYESLYQRRLVEAEAKAAEKQAELDAEKQKREAELAEFEAMADKLSEENVEEDSENDS